MNNRQKCGFTLLEVIIGISIIGLVITAAASLTQSSLEVSAGSLKKFQAYHLSEEGLEIVRNLRDSNWLRNLNWNNGFEQNNTYKIEENSSAGQNGKWRLASDSEGERISLGNADFSRIIEISYEDPLKPVALVRSRVSYPERGRERSVEISAELTDWKKGPL